MCKLIYKASESIFRGFIISDLLNMYLGYKSVKMLYFVN